MESPRSAKAGLAKDGSVAKRRLKSNRLTIKMRVTPRKKTPRRNKKRRSN